VSADDQVKPPVAAEADAPKPATPAEAFALAAAQEGPLQKRLDAYSAHSRVLRPQINAAYDELIARVSGLQKAGPSARTLLPEFQIPDQDGHLVSLEELLSNGPLVLSLNRGHWCPWCRLELRALAQIHGEARKLGAQAVSITPETASYSKRLIADNGLPFTVLTDLDLAYALSLGLMIWVGDTIRASYLQSGLDLAQFHRSPGWFLPIPATFVIGTDGMVKARFVEPDFRKRMEPQDILCALRKLSKS